MSYKSKTKKPSGRQLVSNTNPMGSNITPMASNDAVINERIANVINRIPPEGKNKGLTPANSSFQKLSTYLTNVELPSEKKLVYVETVINSSLYKYSLPENQQKILSDYTQDTEPNDIKDDDTWRQIEFPTTYKLTKLISAFNNIKQVEPNIANTLMSFFADQKLIMNNEDELEEGINPNNKYVDLISWVQENSQTCKIIHNILDNWGMRTTDNFTVFTGFVFEIPDVGNYRNTVVSSLQNLSIGNTMTLPFVLSTSISPYVAKRFANNDTDIILQINIPAGIQIPYISNILSQELEVLINMYGIFKKSETALDEALSDVKNRVIRLDLVGFQQFDFRQIDANVNDICNIIKSYIDPRYPMEPSVIDNQKSFGGNKRKTITKRRRYRNVTKRLKTKRKTETKRKTKSRK